MSGGKVRFMFAGRRLEFDLCDVSPQPIDETLYPSINSLALDVSGRCNMKCLYCAESETMPPRPPMSGKVLMDSVDALFRWSTEGTGVSVHLGSGEPLLQPESVIEIGRRVRTNAKNEKRPYKLYLTTNGTLFNEEIANRLIADGWNIKISLDGGPETHDKYRVDRTGNGTYRKVSRWVKELSKKIPGRFSTTSVLCQGIDPMKVFENIARLGVKKIEMVPVAAAPDSSLLLRDNDLVNYRQYIVDYVRRLASGEDVPINIGFQRRLKKVLGYGNTMVPCGAGRRFFAAGPNGIIYPCFRFVGLTDYEMGKLVIGINSDSVKRFTEKAGRPFDKRVECKKCWAAPLCGGPCFACVELLRAGRPSKDFCKIVKTESMAAVWLAKTLREEDPARLLEYLGVELG